MASSTASIKYQNQPSMMVAQGNIYHLLNPIETTKGSQYVQLYMMDDQEKELAERLKRLAETRDPNRHSEPTMTDQEQLEILGELQACSMSAIHL